MSGDGVVGFEMTLKAGTKTLGKAQNAQLSIDGSAVNFSTFSSGKWRDKKPGMLEWSLSADQIWVPDDEGVQAINDSLLNGTNLSVELKNEDGNGFGGTCFVINIKPGVSGLNDAVMSSFEASGTGPLALLEASS